MRWTRRRAVVRRSPGAPTSWSSDDGFAGTVVQVATRASAPIGRRLRRRHLRVEAGEPWDGIVAEAVAEGLAGVEALTGIRGSAGATPVQNVGAYGQDVSQALTPVDPWDRRDRAVRTLGRRRRRWRTGTRAFKGTHTPSCFDVLFELIGGRSAPMGMASWREGGGRVARGSPSGGPQSGARAAAVSRHGARPADHDTWSCGSFLTNPVLAPGDFADLESRVASLRGATRRCLRASPGRGRRQDQRGVAHRAGRVRQGVRPARARPRCRPSTPWR